MEKITSRQLDVFNEAFTGFRVADKVIEVARTLTKDQAHEIISLFHGASWAMSKYNPNMEVRAKAGAKLNACINALKAYGYKDDCLLCHQDRSTCTC